MLRESLAALKLNSYRKRYAESIRLPKNVSSAAIGVSGWPAMVSDLWAVRSFALALPIIRDIIEEPFELVDRSSSHVAIPAVEGTFPAVSMNLYEIDRILQHAEIQSRDLQPVEAIALITQALTAIIRHAPSLIAFEIIERALKLSEHLVSNPNSLSATQILLNWIHLKPEASIRVTRKHAEALIATSACALALSTLQNAQQVVSADLLARTAQAEALLGLGRDAEAVTFFEKVLKLDQRSDSAASTRCYAGLAQAFVNASAYRNAAKMLELGILALERRILRRGHAPVRAMRMARMLNLEREIDLISEKPMRRVLSAVSVLKVAVKQFGPIPALIQAIARLKPPA